MQAAKLFARTDAQTGETFLAKTIAMRLAEFWEQHPVSDGWSITREAEFAQVQLPRQDGEPLPCVQFTCTIARNAAAVAQASTLQPISGEKAWEMGETNAVSRALNLLGFGAEHLSADEAAQNVQMERVIAERKPVMVAVPDLPAESPATTDAKPRFPPAVHPKVATAPVAVNAIGVRDSVFNQVVQRARLLAVPLPDFGSKGEFDEFRKKLAKYVPEDTTGVPS
jgi:hypothetical protein